jgi:hypothetical protein
MDKWDVVSAVACIKRNRGRVSKDKKITHPGPGIKVLGAIDYLVHYQGFYYMKQKPKNR